MRSLCRILVPAYALRTVVCHVLVPAGMKLAYAIAHTLMCSESTERISQPGSTMREVSIRTPRRHYVVASYAAPVPDWPGSIVCCASTRLRMVDV
eukprot:555008-Rhodomonas_salina.2